MNYVHHNKSVRGKRGGVSRSCKRKEGGCPNKLKGTTGEEVGRHCTLFDQKYSIWSEPRYFFSSFPSPDAARPEVLNVVRKIRILRKETNFYFGCKARAEGCRFLNSS